MQKKLIGIVFALVLALTTFTSSALAHECIVASRSDTGSVMAGTKSQMWYYFGDLTWLFSMIHFFLAPEGGPPLQALSPSQISWAVDQAKAAGIPNSLTVFTSENVGKGTGVLLGGTPVDGSSLTGNGKGIDHIGDYFPKIASIYFEALAH